jgi:hypothetical protein
MGTGGAVIQPTENAPRGELRLVAREHVEQFCALCGGFLRWERERILKKDPGPKERQEHQQTLRWLLRAARLLHSLSADPDFPEPSARQQLEGVIWQMEESWKAIYEPMPEPQADLLLREIYPDEPRA